MARCQNKYRFCQGEYDPSKRYCNHGLCAECLQRRREKQRLTAMQPTCRCGNKAAMGETQCSGCKYKAERRERELDELAIALYQRQVSLGLIKEG